MIITRISNPHLTEVDNGQAVQLHLNADQSILISTAAEADAIRCKLTKALHFFEQQALHDGLVADWRAARDMSEANAVEHLECGGTMRGFMSLPSRRQLEDGAA